LSIGLLQPNLIPFWAFAASLAVLGAIWGSFAAALCLRWPNGQSILTGRSHCDHCGAILRPHELVPIVSYIFQKGRCRHCSDSIGGFSLQIELACAALGLITAFAFQGYAGFAAALFFWLLVPLAVLDWKHLWLPDSLIIILALSGLLLGEFVSGAPWDARLIGGAAGFAALQAIRLAYQKLRGVDGMGGGDPKLLGAIGLWMGWQALPIIIMMASAVGLAWFLIKAGPEKANAIQLPLGSFLSVSAFLLLVFIAVGGL
jgi:leader peptidase (prepilin peptidase)/N-methyltransferase